MIVHPPLDKKTSLLVQQQLPEFVVEDHPMFISFLEAYYEWMEKTGNSYEIIGNLPAYGDIDRTVDEFVAFFKQEFLVEFPTNTLLQDEFLIKNVREFYRDRGSEKSFKFFFKAVYDDDITISLPGDLLLRTSDGKWVQEPTVKVLTDSIRKRNFDTTGIRVTGETSGASAIFESFVKLFEGVNAVTQYRISATDGDFTIGETLSGTDQNGDSFSTVIEGQLIGANITNPGSGYSIGDFLPATGGGPDATTMTLSVKEITNGSITSVIIDNAGTGYSVGEYLIFDNTNKLGPVGKGAAIRISSVGGGGQITGLEIEDGGREYISLPSISGIEDIWGVASSGINATFTPISTSIGGIKNILITQPGVRVTANPSIDASGSGDGLATLTPVIGTIFTGGTGRHLNTDGFLSSDKVLQDSFFFQDFSYVINSTSQSINIWRDAVKKILHPAGMILFGGIKIENLLDLSFPSIQLFSGGQDAPNYVVSFFGGQSPEFFADLQMTLANNLGIDISQNFTFQVDAFAGTDFGWLGYTNFLSQGGFSGNDVPTSLLSIEVTDGGNYGGTPIVIFDNTGTGGGGAAGTAVMDGTAVESIIITNAGSGYTLPPTISFSGGSEVVAATALAGIPALAGGSYLTGFSDLLCAEVEDFPRRKQKFVFNSFIELKR